MAVYIESMAPRGPNPRGTCAMIPEFGALSATMFTSLLTQPLPEIVRKIDVDEKGVYWSKRVTLPYKPHIGTFAFLGNGRASLPQRPQRDCCCSRGTEKFTSGHQ